MKETPKTGVVLEFARKKDVAKQLDPNNPLHAGAILDARARRDAQIREEYYADNPDFVDYGQLSQNERQYIEHADKKVGAYIDMLANAIEKGVANKIVFDVAEKDTTKSFTQLSEKIAAVSFEDLNTRALQHTPEVLSYLLPLLTFSAKITSVAEARDAMEDQAEEMRNRYPERFLSAEELLNLPFPPNYSYLGEDSNKQPPSDDEIYERQKREIQCQDTDSVIAIVRGLQDGSYTGHAARLLAACTVLQDRIKKVMTITPDIHTALSEKTQWQIFDAEQPAHRQIRTANELLHGTQRYARRENTLYTKTPETLEPQHTSAFDKNSRALFLTNGLGDTLGVLTIKTVQYEKLPYIALQHWDVPKQYRTREHTISFVRTLIELMSGLKSVDGKDPVITFACPGNERALIRLLSKFADRTANPIRIMKSLTQPVSSDAVFHTSKTRLLKFLHTIIREPAPSSVTPFRKK